MNQKSKYFLLLFAAVLIVSLINCGGQKPELVTEPVKQTKPQKIVEKKEQNTPPQPIKQKDETIEVKQIDEITEPITAADGRVELQKPLGFNLKNEEVIPIIPPEQKSNKIDTLEALEIKKIMDRITAGMINIFREFGYTGDIDIPDNFLKRVAYYINYFSNDEKGSRYYLRSMSRGGKYFPMIKKVLQEKHLPLSLAHLPIIESGFNPVARSRAGAVGMWQFMKGTGRMYGLKISRGVDERKDPIKSSYAAAEYLNDLLAMFGLEDPFLGICAFNAGEGKILRALRTISYKERSFWTLVKKDLLRNETNEYIPQLIAAILIANNPTQYTTASKLLSIKPNDAEDQQIITSLHQYSSKESHSEEENGNARNTSTENNKKSISSPVTYKVKPGDNLFQIAKKFNIYIKNIKKYNNLKSNKIYPGQKLKIPGNNSNSSLAKKVTKQDYKLIYTVNYSDSLARIALFFKGVETRDIMKWNKLRRSRIYPKQKLVLYLNNPPRKVITHVVKQGESAYRIARRYNLRMEYVLSLNGLVSKSKLQPGQRLKIYYFN